MRVLVTGASGWIGAASSAELRAAGHHVVGIARSDAAAARLDAAGIEVVRGDLDDLAGLRAAAEDAEAVLHLANKHDFARPAVSNAAERGAVQAIGEVLAGSDRPFLFAAGAGASASGRPGTELDRTPFHGPDAPRGGAENLALSMVEQGLHAVSVRFPPTVHGAGDHGFIAALVDVARSTGVSAYVADGEARWSAVHRSDAARVVARGLELAPAGAVLHAVAEEGVPTREIAEAIGAGLALPVRSVSADEAGAHFGWIGTFFGMDRSATSMLTREMLDWAPTGPTLLEDLATDAYFRSPTA